MTMQEMKERLIAIILERSFKYRDNPPFIVPHMIMKRIRRHGENDEGSCR